MGSGSSVRREESASLILERAMSKFTPTKRYSALKKLRQAAALLDEARVLCFAKPDLAERLGADFGPW